VAPCLGCKPEIQKKTGVALLGKGLFAITVEAHHGLRSSTAWHPATVLGRHSPRLALGEKFRAISDHWMLGATGLKARGDFLTCDQQANDGITTALEVSADIRPSGMSMNFTAGIR